MDAPGRGHSGDTIQTMKRWLILLAAIPAQAGAVAVILSKAPNSELYLRVGSPGATVDTVTFNVPMGALGNGQPITGNPPVEIEARLRAPPPKEPVAQLTVDSSSPLTSNGETLSFTEFSWTSSDTADIPSGRFDGTASQLIAEIPPPRRHQATLTFQFDNDIVVGAGTYTGQVTFTLSVP